MSDMSVREAAERLGVHQTRVRALLVSGRLAGRRVGSVWLVDSGSLERRLAMSAAARGRPMSTRTAWSAAALLDGQATPWLATSERARLRTRLRQHDATESQIYRWWLQSRSSTIRYRLADSDVAELVSAPGVVAGGISAASAYGLGLGHGAEAEVYGDLPTIERLVDEFFLVEADRGNLAVHAVDSATSWHQLTAREEDEMLVVPRLVVAADLLERDDTRSRSAGARLLGAVLKDSGGG